jgi:hypothetical protein
MMIEALRSGIHGLVSQSTIVGALRVHGAEPNDASLNTLADRLLPFIHSVPEALNLLIRLGKEAGYGRGVAFGTSQVLLYVMDEQDLMPESAHDPIGVLDDAYLVHRYLTRVCESYPAARARLNYRLVTEAADLDFVGRLLPDGVAAALDRTCENLLTVGAALFSTAESPTTFATEPLAFNLRLERS